MKNKLETALKTAYSEAGFEASVISAVADYLGGSVKSEEEIETAVGGVKPMLKALQSSFDKARGDKSKHEKEIEELKAKLDTLEKEPKQHPTPNPNPSNPKNDFDDRLSNLQKMFDEKLGEAMGKLKSYEDADAAAKRNTFIVSKAAELGIPQSRIDEGFVIPGDADETAISEHLSKVAENIVAIQVQSGSKFQMPGEKELSIEEGEAILKRIQRK